MDAAKLTAGQLYAMLNNLAPGRTLGQLARSEFEMRKYTVEEIQELEKIINDG